MKMLILMEVDVSKTVGETMQRTGFGLALDGTCMQVKVPNAPAVPQRKTKVVFVANPRHEIKDLLQILANTDGDAFLAPVASESK